MDVDRQELQSADEKKITTIAVSDDETTPSSGARSLDEVRWTAEEEKRLVRKIDFVVMPLLISAFFALQLDRGNIGNALTDFFMEDVGITQSQFNVGQQLLALGIVLWEIPSNLVLYRIGPSLWLTGQIFAWGLVATLQAFQHGVGPYMATRFILGTCESGFIPAGFYTMTRWYKRDESSQRFSIFFLGNMFVQALGGDIAYGVLHMRGIANLTGWQWLFIIEGLITISVGIVFGFLFPKSPQHPVSLSNIRWFTERESEILYARVVSDDPTKRQGAKNVTKAELKRTLTNWKLIPHIIFTICGLSPCTTLLSYGPSLVAEWGYGRLEANAIISIGPWCMVVLNILVGFWADKISLRGPLVLLGGFFWWIFILANRLEVYNTNTHTRLGLLLTSFMFSQIWHPLNGSWMALNAQSAGERSITMAILIMSANAGGIIGSQFFQESDAPLYPIGWTAITAVVGVAFACMIWANVQYWLLNKRLAKRGSDFRYQQ